MKEQASLTVAPAQTATTTAVIHAAARMEVPLDTLRTLSRPPRAPLASHYKRLGATPLRVTEDGGLENSSRERLICFENLSAQCIMEYFAPMFVTAPQEQRRINSCHAVVTAPGKS
jgi:hypothetical protein